MANATTGGLRQKSELWSSGEPHGMDCIVVSLGPNQGEIQNIPTPSAVQPGPALEESREAAHPSESPEEYDRPMTPAPASSPSAASGGEREECEGEHSLHTPIKPRLDYMFPVDDSEKDRSDHMHHVICGIRGKLHDVKLPKQARVLDLSAGTGIWAHEFSDAFWKGPGQHASVDGLDLSLMQLLKIPCSVSFKQGDIEDAWLFEPGYDLIHI